IANPTMPEVGDRYLGTVVKTTTFGAFVSLLPGKDGLLHISQIRELHGGERIENLGEAISIGEKVQVEIREIDDRGKLSLIPVEVVEDEAAGTESVTKGEQGDGTADKGDNKDGGEQAPRRRRRRNTNRSENT